MFVSFYRNFNFVNPIKFQRKKVIFFSNHDWSHGNTWSLVYLKFMINLSSTGFVTKIVNIKASEHFKNRKQKTECVINSLEFYIRLKIRILATISL